MSARETQERGQTMAGREVASIETSEERLQRARSMEAVGRLVSGISHDLGDILTIVASTSDRVGEMLLVERPDLREELEDLQSAAQRGIEMVGRLSAFSCRGKRRLRPLDLASVVDAAVEMLKALLPEGWSLAVESSPDGDYRILGSAPEIQRILLNLTSNARDAMPDGGTVTIRLHGSNAGSPVRLVVSDTGVGMDASTRARAFDPFFTTKGSGGSTGLGLTVVHELVHQQGGIVALKSDRHQGTDVQLSFPPLRDSTRSPDSSDSGSNSSIGAEDDEGAGRKESTRGSRFVRRSEPGSAAGGPDSVEDRSHARVLLVEDDEMVRRTAKRVLERSDVDVVPLSDGAEALEFLKDAGGRVTVIIADLQMPRVGGRELYLRAREGGYRGPFVITSGHIDSDVEALLETDAGLSSLAKPWTVAGLVATVEECVRAGRL